MTGMCLPMWVTCSCKNVYVTTCASLSREEFRSARYNDRKSPCKSMQHTRSQADRDLWRFTDGWCKQVSNQALQATMEINGKKWTNDTNNFKIIRSSAIQTAACLVHLKQLRFAREHPDFRAQTQRIDRCNRHSKRLENCWQTNGYGSGRCLVHGWIPTNDQTSKKFGVMTPTQLPWLKATSSNYRQINPTNILNHYSRWAKPPHSTSRHFDSAKLGCYGFDLPFQLKCQISQQVLKPLLQI